MSNLKSIVLFFCVNFLFANIHFNSLLAVGYDDPFAPDNDNPFREDVQKIFNELNYKNSSKTHSNSLTKDGSVKPFRNTKTSNSEVSEKNQDNQVTSTDSADKKTIVSTKNNSNKILTVVGFVVIVIAVYKTFN